MTVNNINAVDAIGVETESQKVVLTIVDHLDWDDENNHLIVLQEKINAYLRFIESGELIESYSDAEGRKVLIDIVGNYELVDRGREFLSHAQGVLRNAGFELRFRRFTPG